MACGSDAAHATANAQPVLPRPTAPEQRGVIGIPSLSLSLSLRQQAKTGTRTRRFGARTTEPAADQWSQTAWRISGADRMKKGQDLPHNHELY
jgi:hypothetical protein